MRPSASPAATLLSGADCELAANAADRNDAQRPKRLPTTARLGCQHRSQIDYR